MHVKALISPHLPGRLTSVQFGSTASQLPDAENHFRAAKQNHLLVWVHYTFMC